HLVFDLGHLLHQLCRRQMLPVATAVRALVFRHLRPRVFMALPFLPGGGAASRISATDLVTPTGVMPCSVLKRTCFSRRRSVSSMAFCMESVMRSAYRMALPFRLRAARPMV